jgi:hypothetical protein
LPGEGSRPPSVSGSIQLSTLPAGPERSLRLFGLAPVGSRRFTRSPKNVTDKRIILDRGCVVSAPLPGLSPNHFCGPPSLGGGTFLSWVQKPYRQLPSLSWRISSGGMSYLNICLFKRKKDHSEVRSPSSNNLIPLERSCLIAPSTLSTLRIRTAAFRPENA